MLPGKSAVIICKNKEHHLKFPDFEQSDKNLIVWDKVKYAGHLIIDQITAKEDGNMENNYKLK